MTTTPRANTATVLTAAISPDVRQSHIAAIQGLGQALAGVRAGKDIAEAVKAAMPEDYDWTAKHGRSTAVTRAVHIWATGTDEEAQWPQMTRAGEDGARVRTHYATGVDAVSKHLRAMVTDKTERTVDWLGLFASAAHNAEENGFTLTDMVARLLETVGEASETDSALASKCEAILKASAALRQSDLSVVA